jgi:hypothetical protein
MGREKSRRFLVALRTIAFLTVGACTTQPLLPGTQLGTYAVVGTLVSSTCGSGIDAMTTLGFSVEVAEDGANAYAVNTDGTNELIGAWKAPTATITSSATATPGSDGGGLCSLAVGSTFVFTFDSPTQPESFAGSAVYAYSVATSSTPAECADELSTGGGSYATLPCTVTYSLTGTRK